MASETLRWSSSTLAAPQYVPDMVYTISSKHLLSCVRFLQVLQFTSDQTYRKFLRASVFVDQRSTQPMNPTTRTGIPNPKPPLQKHLRSTSGSQIILLEHNSMKHSRQVRMSWCFGRLRRDILKIGRKQKHFGMFHRLVLVQYVGGTCLMYVS